MTTSTILFEIGEIIKYDESMDVKAPVVQWPTILWQCKVRCVKSSTVFSNVTNRANSWVNASFELTLHYNYAAYTL